MAESADGQQQVGVGKELVFGNLSEFQFREVLNSDATRKAIFVLLEHTSEKKLAILICDKHAFEEEPKSIAEWVAGSKLQFITNNDVYGNYEIILPENFNQIKSTLIYPATEKHVQKYRRHEIFLLTETPNDYQLITREYIKESQLSLKWVYNFLEKKSEAGRIVYEDPDKTNGFLLAPDLKWNGQNLEELYLQAVVFRRDIHSLRDLTANELPLLENIRTKVAQVILEKYGLKNSQLKMFFHYQPSYYHLHVHIVNVKYDAPGLGVTSILLDTVIDNIKLMSDYYQKATLSFIRRENDQLYKMFHDAGQVKK